MTNKEITGTLEHWYPDNWFRIIWGQVWNDSKKRFFNGTLIHTSDLIMTRKQMNELKEGDEIVTRNSIYKLGKKKEWSTEVDME